MPPLADIGPTTRNPAIGCVPTPILTNPNGPRLPTGKWVAVLPIALGGWHQMNAALSGFELKAGWVAPNMPPFADI